MNHGVLVWLFDLGDAVGCGALILLGILVLSPLAVFVWNPGWGILVAAPIYLWLYRMWRNRDR